MNFKPSTQEFLSTKSIWRGGAEKSPVHAQIPGSAAGEPTQPSSSAAALHFLTPLFWFHKTFCNTSSRMGFVADGHLQCLLLPVQISQGRLVAAGVGEVML